MSVHQSTFLSGANAPFIAELYERFLENPSSVEPSWVQFFRGLQEDGAAVAQELRGASWAPRSGGIIAHVNGVAATAAAAAAAGQIRPPIAAGQDATRKAIQASIRALMLIRAYRVRGHLIAALDPLGIEKRPVHADLDPASYGFDEDDLDQPIYIDRVLGRETATLREIVQILRDTYCQSIGVEFMHIMDPEQRIWIQERIEGERNHTDFTAEGKRAILERLTAAETFERFADRRYTGTKRFGLEGGESLIPALEQIVKRGGQLGVRELVLGMPHRGRLNVLANFMGKPFAAIFSEFQGNSAKPDDVQGSGDVKYHMGTSADREYDGNVVHLSLSANPSHLEAVNPVTLGKVRAKQRQRGDVEKNQVVGLLMHGDAAFAGQGVVAETLMLSELRGYRTGGTINVVVNNQIGFTTAPAYARSGPYCTDVAKMVQAPIFHVNGDDPESVVHVARVAIEFRQRFKRDVVIDMVCYRRHGHNEGDEPAFTQPEMYRQIDGLQTTRRIYAERLEREGIVQAGEADGMVDRFTTMLDSEFNAARSYKANKADWLEGAWAGLGTATADDRRGETAVAADRLQQVGQALTRVPEGFNLNRKIARQLEAKKKMFETGEGIDWATGEALAFGTLCAEGTPVRLSGQDVGRGTFSQRHAVLVDQSSEERYVPVSAVAPGQATFEVWDSPLSEEAVLGFEYGFTLADPQGLVLWEAQFGDFANGAQVIIDQFICSGESKWLRMSGLVLLLPHGYEGQGPEHSSARLERFLQLSAEDNMQVVNLTTPANYFHALRRQMRRSFRKPLIVMTPKSLLRHKRAVSKLAEFGPGSSFHRVLWDDADGGLSNKLVADAKIRRVVLCSGKVYYDLLEARETKGIDDVYLMRVEQLYPFPAEKLALELKRFPAADVVWCQEEPRNMGGWYFVDRRIEDVLTEVGGKATRPRYVGRPDSASTATGLLRRHNEEQEALVSAALTI
ncbi:2-oxoglutarate dehydrogenase E1 component [Stella humosa]|uniref:2-oxoglutarate dehydrogenase E1 component n=1 Tax=Stella humosa TaxID=94 RepID=A0A3N1KYZ7_9PROT|nr:2-oxoglutarate dehydrogenase E1 component [Stella humosa]ROP84642.1 2-oxoglutarate dehydrogenase E1 component [Stella humosa]BBK34162.1 2-oxoglutarate dehydrogenase subunit E1 [Stella humosa]